MNGAKRLLDSMKYLSLKIVTTIEIFLLNIVGKIFGTVYVPKKIIDKGVLNLKGGLKHLFLAI